MHNMWSAAEDDAIIKVSCNVEVTDTLSNWQLWWLKLGLYRICVLQIRPEPDINSYLQLSIKHMGHFYVAEFFGITVLRSHALTNQVSK